MPFRTRIDQPRDLTALVDAEVRERIEDAVDYVTLEIMVAARRAHGQPAPTADSSRDRQEFSRGVGAFLERLQTELLGSAPAAVRQKADAAATGADDILGRLIATQVELAKALPEYWQRFEEIRAAYSREQLASGGERRRGRRGLFGR
jgi:hypothetical protein